MKTKWKIVIGILVGLAAVSFFLFNQLRPLEAETAEVQLRDISRFFTEEGKVVPKTEQTVYSLYGGEIKDVHVKEGQTVSRGDLLVELDSSELDFQLRQLQAQLRSVQGEEAGTTSQPYEASVKSQELQITLAELSLQAALNNFSRIETLYQAGAVSEKDFEDANDMLEASRINLKLQQEALKLLYESRTPAGGTQQFYQGRIDAIRAQLELLEYQIGKAKILSPLTGTVANLSVKGGDPAAPGIPMMTVFTGDQYEVEVFILAEDVLSVKAGMEVELIHNRQGEEHLFAGKVTRIAPTALETVSALGLAEQRVKVSIEPSLDDQTLFFPGVRLDVRFVTDQRENVIAVRKTLVFSYEDGDALWVVDNGRAQIRPVVTGFENDRDIVIDSGLAPGDHVLLNPQLRG